MAKVKVHNPITGTMRAIAVVGLLGVLAYDGIQLGVHRVNATDAANNAAQAAEEVIFNVGNTNKVVPGQGTPQEQACVAAQAYAHDHGATLDLSTTTPTLKAAADPSKITAQYGNCRSSTDSSIDVELEATAQKIVLGRFAKSLIAFRVHGHADKEG
jgi:hypothetical protein